VYHRVTDDPHPDLAYYAVSPGSFRSQMRALRLVGWKTVSLDQLLAARRGELSLPRRSVVVTFDDAYAELEDEAIPTLAANGQTATVYACAGLLGADADALRRPGHEIHEEARLMDADALRRIRARGFEVGSHSLTHPHLPALDDATLEAEVAGSKGVLEEELGEEVRHFAYPFGDYDERVRAQVEATGYASAVTTDPGAADRLAPRLGLPRVYVGREDSWARLLARLSFRG
jgi:peptidoglycan/xylan/chitin deacetylase (PgdA/CDA1 family)